MSWKSQSEYINLEQLTLASDAGFTFPFTKKAPPRRTICPMFFENAGSRWIAYTNGYIIQNIMDNIQY